MKHMLRIALVSALAATLPAQETSQTPAGQAVSGVVRTLSGEPVAGAMAFLQPLTAKEMIKTSLTAGTGADGRFTVKNVPEGEYRVCVPQSSTGVLDPCVWGGFPVRIEVTSKAAPSEARVVVNQGVELSLVISDTGKLLSAHDERKAGRPALMIGVMRPGVPFIQMRLVSGNEAGRQYKVFVPSEVNLDVMVASEDFEFEEEKAEGKADFAAATNSLKASLKLPRDTKKKELRVSVREKK